jgi:hypothetical protein
LVAVLAVVGCADTQSTFDRVFPTYRGQPVEMVFARWGQPQHSLTGNLGPVYIWTGDFTYSSTQTSSTTGYIGSTPIAVTTRSPERTTIQCRLEAHADRQNRLIGMRWDGSNGACEAWMQKLG